MNVPIKESHRRYFQFRWKGKLYRCVTLPFGYKDAPRVFTACIKVPIGHLRKQGILCSFHLDDILLVTIGSQEEARRTTRKACELLIELGFTISTEPEKSVFEPTRRILYGGLMWDTENMTVSLGEDRKTRAINCIEKSCRQLQNKGHLHIKQLESLVGTLGSLRDVVDMCRLKMNHLVWSVHEAPRKEGNPTWVQINEQARRELQEWKENIELWDGKLISSIQWFTHAIANADAGPLHHGVVVYDSESERHELTLAIDLTKKEHQNVEEYKAAIYAVKLTVKLCREKGWPVTVTLNILVLTDNKTVLSYINKFGGRKVRFIQLTQELFEFCQKENVRLRADFVPGKENEADAPSRPGQYEREDWSLNQEVWRRLSQARGPFRVDCFASETNRRTQVGALYHDFFSRIPPYRDGLYANPPFTLLARLISKIEEEGLTMDVVLPVWVTNLFWPKMLRAMADFPILLPRTKSLFLKPHQAEWLATGKPKWQVWCVTLSGDPGRREEFRRTLRASWHQHISLVEESRRLFLDMIGTGNTGQYGAEREEWIRDLLWPVTRM